MRKYIVDRFESNYAICEDENNILVNIQRNNLPTETKEGDCLIMKDDGNFYIDSETRESRIENIQKKLDDLFE